MAKRPNPSRAKVDRLVARLTTTADKIRALARAGYERADIARHLDIRYQQVRNVLVRDAALREEAATHVEQSPKPEWMQVGADGRVVIPVAYRRLLDVENGGAVQVRVEDGLVRLSSRDDVVRRVQELFAPYLRKGASATEELIAERRAEAAREDEDGRSRS